MPKRTSTHPCPSRTSPISRWKYVKDYVGSRVPFPLGTDSGPQAPYLPSEPRVCQRLLTTTADETVFGRSSQCGGGRSGLNGIEGGRHDLGTLCQTSLV